MSMLKDFLFFLEYTAFGAIAFGILCLGFLYWYFYKLFNG